MAPFKSQNMPLNPFVTRDGGEMGRAQVVQAEAACVEPTVDMNPILLKSAADNRSQVAIMGRPIHRLPEFEDTPLLFESGVPHIYRLSDLLHESRSGTVRLKTRVPERESESTAK